MRSQEIVSTAAIIEAFKGEDLSLETAENEHIESVLRLCGGNKKAAAELLKINRRSLQRRQARQTRQRRSRARGRR